MDSYQSDYFTLINSITRGYFLEIELCCIGAGLGRGFKNTQELKTMKYDEAMNGPDKEKWIKAI